MDYKLHKTQSFNGAAYTQARHFLLLALFMSKSYLAFLYCNLEQRLTTTRQNCYILELLVIIGGQQIYACFSKK